MFKKPLHPAEQALRKAQAQIHIMRANAVLAGITSLSEHVPKFIKEKPTQATDYLYSASVIVEMQNPKKSFSGLCDFAADIVTELASPSSLLITSGGSFLKGERAILRAMAAGFRKGWTGYGEWSLLREQWTYCAGNIDDSYVSFICRDPIIPQIMNRHSDVFVRRAVIALISMMVELEVAKPDWWHKLGSAIRYLAHGGMEDEWMSAGTAIVNPSHSFSTRSDIDFKNFDRAQAEFDQMHWRYQEDIFARLADSLGDRVGKRPDNRPVFLHAN